MTGKMESQREGRRPFNQHGPTGYLHPEYAKSFVEFGKPIGLQGSGGWLIQREIPGTALRDATGCYPLFCCTRWEELRGDLDLLSDELVSVVLVADPFGDYTPALLKGCFDLARPFKSHFSIETGEDPLSFVKKSHRENALRALRKVDVELCSEPLALLGECERLLAVLAERHAITGIRRPSRGAIQRQLAVPGMVMFRAMVNGRTVGVDSWYVQGECAYGHLAAFDEVGYSTRASYATKWRAIEYFNERVRFIHLGGGLSADGGDGLSQFKRGWANTTRHAWLCGRILQPRQFARLTVERAGESYFPPYRSGERNPRATR